MKAIGNNVVIKQDSAEEKSPGGIVIPNEQAPNRGKVVSYGEGEQYLEVGQTVFYRGGWTVEHEGEEFVVVNFDDVLCRV